MSAGPGLGAEIDFAAIIGPVARHLLGEPNKALSSKTQLRFGSRGSVSVEIAGKNKGVAQVLSSKVTSPPSRATPPKAGPTSPNKESKTGD